MKIRLAILLLVAFAATAVDADSVDLAGQWSFKLDPQDRGVAESWPNGTLPDTIKLPGTTDEAGYGTKTTAAETGILTRVVKYYGPAWYQRTVVVPESWKDKDVSLFLERVIWESRVWVDGRLCDSQQSLNTPHLHNLGRLAPGKHSLTIRIDNRPVCPIGVNGHSYTEQTQTVWNGAVGRIELQARDAVHVARTRVFPYARQQKVEAEVSIGNSGESAQVVTLLLELRRRGTRDVVAQTQKQYTVPPGTTMVVRPSLALAQPPDPWDEFAPSLYTLDATAKTANGSDTSRETFGFREVSRVGQHIAINARPIFLRGNLDCVHFPLTGYPTMTVDGWKRIFRIYQANGLNHVRFHTWTPPEAAFVAADELGIYIQCEIVWVQRRLGRDAPGPMESMDSAFPQSLLNPPGTIDGCVNDEIRRVMNAYGNHPSFILFTIGNELGGYDPEACGRWIQEIKQYDPRRFYAVSTARRIVPQDDYNATHDIPGVGPCRDRLEPFNDWDYESVYSKASIPIIAHEVGQWPAFPTWDEIAKYRGVLRARNYEHFRQLAQTNGVAGLDRQFRAASGALSLRLYKDEIESHLRTPSCAGFHLLSMQDFSGQGEALVGWLDSFYDSKGIVTPERFRRWCNATVPLARLPKYVFTVGETLTAKVDVAHYGAKPLSGVAASWSLRDAKGNSLAQGALAPATLPISSVSTIGVVTAKLDRCPAPCRARLEVRLDGTSFTNDWDIWVFPPAREVEREVETAAIEVCDSLDAAIEKLHSGKKVLLDAHRLGSKENAAFARFKPAYWSAWMFRGQYTLGALVRADHAALAGFPTEDHYDWQWEELCRNARAFRLDGLPLDYRPIVQPICDFHFGWKLGAIFELRSREGGSLLVCGYDISNNLSNRPAARQLRLSLLTYMKSPAFKPRVETDDALFARIIPTVKAAPVGMLGDPAKAVLYVKAGAKHPSAGDVAWKPDLDDVRIAAGFAYSVQCNSVWKDQTGTAWWGNNNLRVVVNIPKPDAYDLYVHFHDWNDNGRDGTIKFAGRQYQLGAHNGSGKWVKLEVRPDDCRDGKIVLDAEATAGPNLMITAVALVPRNAPVSPARGK